MSLKGRRKCIAMTFHFLQSLLLKTAHRVSKTRNSYSHQQNLFQCLALQTLHKEIRTFPPITAKYSAICKPGAFLYVLTLNNCNKQLERPRLLALNVNLITARLWLIMGPSYPGARLFSLWGSRSQWAQQIRFQEGSLFTALLVASKEAVFKK